MVRTEVEALFRGEFSRITGLTVKTLRFYHEKGVLAPSEVDESTGYRYYDRADVEKARVVTWFREMEIPLGQIKEILDCADDESGLLDHLERHKQAIEEKIRQYRSVVVSLDQFSTLEREAVRVMQNSTFEVEEKTVDGMLIAAIRMQAKYGDCGKGFARLGRSLGRHICGKPFCLHYDCEYKEIADYETCVPIRQEKQVEGISVRQLPGGRCVALMHKGPYDQLGRSYAKITAYVEEHGYEVIRPTREVYIKGPGMVFRGNPNKYLTEIQMLIQES
jgi:DNA-binding transcriptional MerR regulator